MTTIWRPEATTPQEPEEEPAVAAFPVKECGVLAELMICQSSNEAQSLCLKPKALDT